MKPRGEATVFAVLFLAQGEDAGGVLAGHPDLGELAGRQVPDGAQNGFQRRGAAQHDQRQCADQDGLDGVGDACGFSSARVGTVLEALDRLRGAGALDDSFGFSEVVVVEPVGGLEFRDRHRDSLVRAMASMRS